MSDGPIRDALKMMPYGFYGITTKRGDDVNAMTANWVMQVSFEPRLIALGLQKTSYTHGLIEPGVGFAVNLFKKADAEKIKPFTRGRAKNPHKMEDASFRPAPATASPVLDGAAAYVECRVVRVVDIGGDHDIVVGEVVGAEVMKPGEASATLSLLDLGWSYAG
jgi:flavin reductase (DIM6/NTAB) family NADH-FMN oxidoreductase RutF